MDDNHAYVDMFIVYNVLGEYFPILNHNGGANLVFDKKNLDG